MGRLQEITTPLSPSTREAPTTSSSLECSSERTLRYRSLQEIYEVIKNQNDLTLFCLFANCEPIGFKEAIQDKRWKVAMDEEIKSIRKNDT